MYREIYFDNSATTRPYDEVADYINGITRNNYGNPSSLHLKGIESERLIKKARQAIADSIGADNKEICFTSGGTESNNMAILGYLDANPRKGRHVIASAIEHPSVIEVFRHLESKGYSADYIGVDRNGVIDLEQLKNKLTQETALISIMLVNNEIGSVQPIEEVVRIKNELNCEAVIHVDAVQGYGKIKLNPIKTGIDMLSISSHKIHGPKGVGALYFRKGIRIRPILFGGGQEALLRSGTENVPGICGFGLASEIIHASLESNLTKVMSLKNLLIQKLGECLQDYMIVSPDNAVSHILSMSFGGVRSEVLLHHLEERNIFVSTGSACSSRKNVHSHVLKALNLKPCDIEGTVRFSFSAFNTVEDVSDTVDALKEIVPKININRRK